MTENYGPIARLAPTTLRAQAWLKFHGLRAIMKRADAIADGVRTLPDVLTELLVADLGAEHVEPQSRTAAVQSVEEVQ